MSIEKMQTGDEVLNVGVVGHIDHGKTTLLYKLSGKWTGTHSEELKRGITIKLGYAYTEVYEDNGEYNIGRRGKKIRSISFIDAPGHEMLMATMLSGAALIDVAVLVIAANEGIKPQTKEHLMALKAKGVHNLIVVQNKIDLVDEQAAKKSYQEIKKFVEEYYKNIQIIPVSAQQGVNIDLVLKALCEFNVPKRDLEGEPIFIVARSFDVNKPGTSPEKLCGAVLGGTMKKGVLKVGDEIEIKPGRLIKEANKQRFETIYTKIANVFTADKSASQITPGGSSAIETELDMFFGKADALAGNVVSIKGKLPDVVSSVKLKYELFSNLAVKEVKSGDLKHGEMLLLSINTSLTGGDIIKLNSSEMELSLKKPAVIFKDDYAGIAKNIGGHWRLIGCGRIL